MLFFCNEQLKKHICFGVRQLHTKIFFFYRSVNMLPETMCSMLRWHRIQKKKGENFDDQKLKLFNLSVIIQILYNSILNKNILF